MARATHVKKAQKAVPEHGIAIGDSYYHWKFKNGGKHYSKTPPKPSQLTQSAFYSTLYSIQESLAEQSHGTIEEVESIAEDIMGQLEELKSECEEKLDNMPDSLQQGSTGELIQSRIDALDELICEFDSLDFSEVQDFEVEDEMPDEEELKERILKGETEEAIREEVKAEVEQQKADALMEEIDAFNWSIE